MGVRHVLLLVDPSHLDRCLRVLSQLELGEAASIRSALEEIGGTAVAAAQDEGWLEDVAEGATAETRAGIMNDVLDRAVGASEWDIDKGLGDAGLRRAIELVPALAPFAIFTNFRFDVEVDPATFAPEDSGLYGFFSASRLDACLPAVRRFDTREAARASLDDSAWTWGQRLTGRPARARESVVTWTDEVGWHAWTTMREAIVEATSRRWHLGLSMTV